MKRGVGVTDPYVSLKKNLFFYIIFFNKNRLRDYFQIQYTSYNLWYQIYRGRQELCKISESQDLHWDFMNTYIFLQKIRLDCCFLGQIYTNSYWSESNFFQTVRVYLIFWSLLVTQLLCFYTTVFSYKIIQDYQEYIKKNVETFITL